MSKRKTPPRKCPRCHGCVLLNKPTDVTLLSAAYPHTLDSRVTVETVAQAILKDFADKRGFFESETTNPPKTPALPPTSPASAFL